MKTAKRRLFLVLVVILFVVFVCYGAARLYLADQASRAREMLHALESVRIGDTAASVQSISQKYNGYQWKPKYSGDYEQPDYEFALEVNPWRFGLMTDHPRTFNKGLRNILDRLPSRLRRTIGFRQWNVLGHMSVKDGRVIAVTGAAFVEGRQEWLGGTWFLLKRIPEHELQGSAMPRDWLETKHYSIRLTNFDVYKGWGEAAEIWITPSATQDVKQFATEFKLSCLTSTSGCQTVCDFVPSAGEYVKTGTWEERKKACTPPRSYRYR